MSRKTDDECKRFFLSHYEIVGKCWIWTAGCNGRGRPQITYRGKQVRAHRYAFFTFKGPIAKGKSVLHRCDNIKCVNPKHLFVGTQIDNMEDMVRKERSHKPIGEINGRAVVSEQDVIEIRQKCKPYSKTHGVHVYAKRLGVTGTAIHSIMKRKTWKHIK